MTAWLVIRHLSGSKANNVERFSTDAAAELSIGRDPGATISFDPKLDDVVSRRHAVLRIRQADGPAFEICDLQSSNGTFVNNRRISDACELAVGDTVELGRGGPRFVVEIESEGLDAAGSAAAAQSNPWLGVPASAAPSDPDETATAGGLPPPAEMPEGSIFISYAHEDLAAVSTLARELAAAGVSAWFDIDKLSAGDSFDEHIRSSIDRCSLFLPVLSRNTEQRREAYFRREWRYALDRDMNIDQGVPFIVPVAIDETRTFQRAPRRFLEVHITWLRSGVVTPEFVDRIKHLLLEFRGYV
jgi:pSer/pThr/pTyr-binding forkhead associated (FHA) protein